MKLYEALEANRGRDVKIGAACNFFFAGKVSDETAAEIEEINDAYIRHQVRSIDKYQIKSENVVSELEAKIENAKRTLERKEKGEVIRPERITKAKRLANLSEEEFGIEAGLMRRAYLAQKNRLIEYVRSSKRFMERDVINSYSSIIGDGRILIIEGIEVGKYWTPEEYSSDNSKLDVAEEQGDNDETETDNPA